MIIHECCYFSRFPKILVDQKIFCKSDEILSEIRWNFIVNLLKYKWNSYLYLMKFDRKSTCTNSYLYFGSKRTNAAGQILLLLTPKHKHGMVDARFVFGLLVRWKNPPTIRASGNTVYCVITVRSRQCY